MGPVKGLGPVMAPRAAASGACGGIGRQADDDSRALVRAAGDGDLPPVLFDDLFDGRQSEPGAGGFGGEAGLEDLADVLGGNRRAVVLDRDGHLVPPARALVGHRLEMNVPLGRHGFKGVFEDAQEDLLKLTFVYFDGRERSEEHTSELQSRLHLVCRLLLEKKKVQPTSRCWQYYHYVNIAH